MTLPQSDHFNGKTFFNPGEPADRGLRDLIKWKLSSTPAKWPESVKVEAQPLPPSPGGDGIVATWIGHSTYLIRSKDATLLTDPVFSERAGPFSWAGAKRVAAPALAFGQVPRVDLVLLSHDHYDHCDLPSLRLLAERDNPTIVAPLGFKKLLKGAGMRSIVELDWWQGQTLPSGVQVTFVPALHWCRRVPFATNVRLWGGFVTRTGGRLVYFVGDSGYSETLFKEIGARCGPPDLALIPIGAYEPRWFMKDAHMNPEEAVRVHRDVASRKSAAMHWGTFQLTDEGIRDPVRDLGISLAAAGLAESDFRALEPGASVIA